MTIPAAGSTSPPTSFVHAAWPAASPPIVSTRSHAAVDDIAPRIAERGDDSAIGIGGGVIEIENRHPGEHRIDRREPLRGKRRLCVNAAIELDGGHDRQHRCVVQRRDARFYCLVAVAKMDRDA